MCKLLQKTTSIKTLFLFLQLRKFVIGVIEMIIGIPPECKKYIGESLILQVVVAGQMSSNMTCGKFFIHFERRTFGKKCEVHINE